MQTVEQRSAITSLGREMGPPVIASLTQLFNREQQQLAVAVPAMAVDISYGSHERQVLDIYSVGVNTPAKAVIVFVHGGGFLKGDKGSDSPLVQQ